MATRVAVQNLVVGGTALSASWTPTPERMSITFVAVELVADSLVRCLILDANNRVLASTNLNGSSTKKLSLEGLETAVMLRMEQLAGSAQVTASDGTGGDITADEIATDAVTAAEIAAGAVDTDELADGGVTEEKRDGTPTVIADPGDAGTITPATGGDVICTIDVGTGAETRVLGLPDHIGQRMVIVGGTFGGGSLTITVAAGFMDGGAADDVATITTGDVMVLEACGATAADWRCTSSNGVAFA